MRTASILVFLAHSIPILSGNLNWEGKGKKKKGETAPTQNKKHQPFALVFQNLKKGLSFELGCNTRKQETRFSVLSSEVCLCLLAVSHIPKKK